MILSNNNKWIYSGNKVIDYDGSIPGPIPPVPPEPTVYNVYTYTKGGGSITATPYTGIKGTEVSLSNTPDSNYQFNSYIVDGSSLIGNTFTIKENDVSVTGVFDRIYNVNLTQSTGGTIAANPMRGISGTTVTLSNTPNQGYTFNKYIVTGATLNNNKFTINNSNVNVTAQFNVLPASAILVNLGSNEYKRTSNGTTTVPLTGIPSSTHFNYIVYNYELTEFIGGGNYYKATANLIFRNSNNSTIWRVARSTKMHIGTGSGGSTLGICGLTGSVSKFTKDPSFSDTLWSTTVNDIEYKCMHHYHLCVGNPDLAQLMRIIFDRINKRGYVYYYSYDQWHLVGYGTMNVDPLVINNLAVQISSASNTDVKSMVKNIKVAGFTTFEAAQAWNP